jgi:hypothetical protein
MSLEDSPLMRLDGGIATPMKTPAPPPMPVTAITSPGQALAPPKGGDPWSAPDMVMPKGSMLDQTANSMYLPEAVREAITPEQKLAQGQTEATGFVSGLDTGFQESAYRALASEVGMADRKLPDMRLGENSPFTAKLGAAIGRLPDYVAMGIGAIPGAVLGVPAGPVGMLGGLFLGGASVEGYRSWYMDNLLNGSMTREDIVGRSGNIAKNAAIEGAINAVFGGAMTAMGVKSLVSAGIPRTAATSIMTGAVDQQASRYVKMWVAEGAVAEQATKYAVDKAFRDIGLDAAQQATAQAVRQLPMNAIKNFTAGMAGGAAGGAALHGEVPGWDDLAIQAILMGGMHAGMKGAGSAFSKLGDIWVKTGKLPGEVARDIAERPSILTEMFDVNPVKKAAEAKFLQDHQNVRIEL